MLLGGNIMYLLYVCGRMAALYQMLLGGSMVIYSTMLVTRPPFLPKQTLGVEITTYIYI